MSFHFTPPEVRIFRPAMIQAFTGPIVAPPPEGFCGGIVLGNSSSELRLRHSRYRTAIDRFDEHIISYERINGEYTYLGPLYDHFGHMMSEFVHRAIPSLELGSFPKFLFVSNYHGRNNCPNPIPNVAKEILHFLSIPLENVIVLNNHSEVENLFVCEQGSDFGGGAKEWYLGFLEAYTNHRLDVLLGHTSAHLKTYVSRAKLMHGGNFLGERYIEKLLEDEGFFIMHPQEYPFINQLQLYRSSKILVFPEGSACHGLEFFGRNALEECHLLERRASHKDVFGAIFCNRAKVFSTLSGTHCISSCILHPNMDNTLDHLAQCFIPSEVLLRYFRYHGLAQLPHFSKAIYNQTALEDFERHVSYHKSSGSRMLDDDIISIYRMMLEREISRIFV
jgi:hypothetical protein